MTDHPAPEGHADAARFVGVWELERADEALGLEPGSLMMFLPTGELRYAAPSAAGMQVALLTYRLDGAEIVTDQPSAPGEDRTRYRFDGADTLELTYGAGVARFRRAG